MTSALDTPRRMGGGRDYSYAEAGRDRLVMASGNDRIFATKDVHADELYCGVGFDVVYYDKKTRDFKDNLHRCERVKLVRFYEGF